VSPTNPGYVLNFFVLMPPSSSSGWQKSAGLQYSTMSGWAWRTRVYVLNFFVLMPPSSSSGWQEPELCPPCQGEPDEPEVMYYTSFVLKPPSSSSGWQESSGWQYPTMSGWAWRTRGYVLYFFRSNAAFVKLRL